MALLGTGVMVFWNNIAEGGHDDFLEWHVLEHIPERVGIPGFVRGRRYNAEDAQTEYFNFYETTDPSVLSSSAYLDRLNAPSDWTRNSLTQFRESNRTLCSVAASLGRGEGAAMETLQLKAAGSPDDFKASLSQTVLPAILLERGIVGVHLLEGLTDASRAGTAEKSLRSQPDQVADWVVLIDAVDTESLKAARSGAASDEAFHRGGAVGDISRGIYRLHYALSELEIDRGAKAPLRWNKKS